MALSKLVLNFQQQAASIWRSFKSSSWCLQGIYQFIALCVQRLGAGNRLPALPVIFQLTIPLSSILSMVRFCGQVTHLVSTRAMEQLNAEILINLSQVIFISRGLRLNKVQRGAIRTENVLDLLRTFKNFLYIIECTGLSSLVPLAGAVASTRPNSLAPIQSELDITQTCKFF